MRLAVHPALNTSEKTAAFAMYAGARGRQETSMSKLLMSEPEEWSMRPETSGRLRILMRLTECYRCLVDCPQGSGLFACECINKT